MNKKNIATGIFFIIIGVWFYLSLFAFDIEKGSYPRKLVIREGIARTNAEVAAALANETGFDLKGAYKMGYTPVHVVDFLINEPHKLSFIFYDGEFYEGRITMTYIYPIIVCILFVLMGIAIVVFAGKDRRDEALR